MAKYELRVDVTYGTLVVTFDSTAELEQRLKELDVSGVSRIVETHLRAVAKAEPRNVKPALEGICAFRADGRLELLKPAGSKIEAMGLVLYAHDPDPVALEVISGLVSEKNPAAYLGAKQYAKLFHKVKAGFYTLSQDGRVWVASEVIPKLRKDAANAAGAD
ncbi:MAG TPA: hypothetical protein VN943_17310 [Candidatus Acidoferrum sp.]|nr:hypothetical protein [Candidatus Acidoferrum sp.]